MDDPLSAICQCSGPDRFRISIRVKPNAPRTRVLGIHRERAALEIALHAPPRDGEANEELLRFLRETLAVPRANLSLIAGARSRDKVVEAAVPATHLARLSGLARSGDENEV